MSKMEVSTAQDRASAILGTSPGSETWADIILRAVVARDEEIAKALETAAEEYAKKARAWGESDNEHGEAVEAAKRDVLRAVAVALRSAK